jgi:O-antigen ligase
MLDQSNNTAGKADFFSYKLLELGLTWLAVFLPISMAGISITLTITVAGAAAALLCGAFKLKRSPLDLPLAAYLAAYLLVALLSPDIGKGLRAFSHNWIIALYFVVYALASKQAMWRKLWMITISLGALVAVYTIVQWYTGIDLAGLFGPSQLKPDKSGNYFLGIGMFGHHLTLGNQLMMILAVALGMWFDEKGKKRTWLTICILLLAGGLGYSYSRGPWLGAMGAVMLGGLLKGKKYAVALTLCLIILFSAVFTLSPQLRERFVSIFSFEKNLDRILIWQTSWEMISDHPVKGVGLGQYKHAIVEYQDAYDHSFTSRAHAHNFPMQIAAQGGLILFIPFVFMWLIILREAFGAYRRAGPSYSGLDLGLTMSLAGFLIAGIFQCNFQDSENAILLWLVLGQLIGRHRLALANNNIANGETEVVENS